MVRVMPNDTPCVICATISNYMCNRELACGHYICSNCSYLNRKVFPLCVEPSCSIKHIPCLSNAQVFPSQITQAYIDGITNHVIDTDEKSLIKIGNSYCMSFKNVNIYFILSYFEIESLSMLRGGHVEILNLDMLLTTGIYLIEENDAKKEIKDDVKATKNLKLFEFICSHLFFKN